MSTNVRNYQQNYGLPAPLTIGAPEPIVSPRSPTTTDSAQPGQVWVNDVLKQAFILVSIGSGVNTWVSATQLSTSINVTAAGATVVNNAQVGTATYTGLTTATTVSQVLTLTNSFISATSNLLVSAANFG